MNQQQAHLDAIQDIKKLMERSSKFSALSGFAGVVVGFFALLSIGISYNLLEISPFGQTSYLSVLAPNGIINTKIFNIIALNFGIVLLVSFLTAIWLSNKNAIKKGEQIWDHTSKRMMIHFLIPMFAGGIYCLILFIQNHIALIIPATILFYGLALLNASKYTHDDIKYLGVIMIILGLLASVYLDYALIIWAIGFGLLHILYGSFIYIKYEK
jgi:hypothetical protein